MTGDRLERIDDHWRMTGEVAEDDYAWLIGEIERLRVLAGEASAREILGLPDD